VLGGVIYDETGSYLWTLWLLVATWLICAVVMFIVRPASDPSRRRAPVPA
jgi:bacteriorhodopsin